MTCLHHARMPTLDSHRAGRDSDAVRARLGFRRFRWPVTRTQHDSGSPLRGFDGPDASADHQHRAAVTLSVTPSRQLRFAPLP